MKSDVVVASRAPLLDQAIAQVRASIEAALDFADAAADKLVRTFGPVDQTK